MKLENKMSFFSKNTKEDILMGEEDEKDFKIDNICQTDETKIISNILGNHCHLTSEFRTPADQKCILNVRQKQFFSIYLWQFQ